MSVSRLAVVAGTLCLIASSAAAQSAPQRDAQAVAVVQQSVAAMGKSVPADSEATGTVVLTEGSRTQNGTIRIRTRGLGRSAERIETGEGSRETRFSDGLASEAEDASVRALSLESAVTTQCPDFPLPLLVAALNDPDTAFQYVGTETLDGSSVQHVRFWNTFASRSRLSGLAEFSVKELWVDAASGLPRRLSYVSRAGGGAVPRIPVEVNYSDYRKVGGILYPFRIEKSLNGTPWATITIQSVVFNTGLTDAEFSVE